MTTESSLMQDTEFKDVDSQSITIHRDSTLFLAYLNPVATYLRGGIDYSPLLQDDPAYQGSLPKLKRGNVDVAAYSLGVPTRPFAGGAVPIFEGDAAVQYVLRNLRDFREMLDRAKSEVGIANDVADIENLNAQDRLAVVPHLTGAWCNGDPSVLQQYHHQGVRCIHICIEGLPEIGEASGDAPTGSGLTALGREMVHEMNRLGMVVDIAHAADSTAWQILETSNRPVISSHTWRRSKRPGPRGMPDDLMRAVAEGGGVIGLFLVADPADQSSPPRDEKFKVAFHEKIEELWKEYGSDPYEFLSVRYDWEIWKDFPGISHNPELKPRMTSVENVVAHIDFAVELVGIDHVGLGPDYEMGIMIPEGLETAADLPRLTAALLKRGYSPDDVRKILGGNFIRVFREIIG